VVGDHLITHSEQSDYTPLHRWRFELTKQYTGSIYQALRHNRRYSYIYFDTTTPVLILFLTPFVCYALLSTKALSISYAEEFLVLFYGKVKYDKSS
jgi:hypothetical protein